MQTSFIEQIKLYVYFNHFMINVRFRKDLSPFEVIILDFMTLYVVQKCIFLHKTLFEIIAKM